MAQLILTAASSIGGAVAKAGLGAAIGRTIASTAASYAAGIAERLIFGPKKRKVVGPRLESFQVQASTEGAPILRVYGRARVAGQIIWAANFREREATSSETSGKGGRLGTKTTTTEYLYSISLAVGLCEGPIGRIGRVWADGKPFDLSPHNVRVHRGTEDQLPDALVEAVEGAGKAPAFRGLAYIVFEDLPLKDFGNRIPQLAFEIEKPLLEEDPEALENALTAVTMIPGSGEFVYGTTRVMAETREGAVVPENQHNNDGATDFVAALDALLAAAPNLQAVSLVVSWFGTDLRAGACLLKPGVETGAKTTTPYSWRVGGIDREDAHQVSLIAGAPAYGGTPADPCVLEAIARLKARGLEVTLHPFILMDIPSGNGLPDPYGGPEQARYPWRGRITVGANDKTAAAAADIAHFFGAAAPAHFTSAGGEVVYSGPDEWSFRRMILHYARLGALAGVDRFLIGSELRGLTTARSGPAAFPAVAAMRALAADVRNFLGPGTKLSYAADWSEYFGHQPADGSGDVFFHLDPLWADANIDFVGVDNYLPLADWRDGFAHLDAQAGFAGPNDRTYLKANIEAGERYDFYYASAADRLAQTRSAIADGAYGEPWVFRPKDFRNWWGSAHYDRPGGVRATSLTAWVAQGKPIVFTETGCPHVDKGANEPNVFVDPKSAESAIPHFSTGARDDLAGRRYLEALTGYWRDPANNPQSSVYGAPMIDADRAFAYAFDARPFPFFPALSGVWGDAANWSLGHWLNGRLGRAPLDLLVAALARDGAAAAGVAVDASRLSGVVAGYVLDRPMSPREAIDPLADIFQFDLVETPAGLRFQSRRAEPLASLAADDLVLGEGGPVAEALAGGEALPAAFRLGYIDEANDYAPAAAEARDPAAAGGREDGEDTAIVFGEAEAAARARAILADGRVMRRTARFTLPPSRAAIEPGDVVLLDPGQAPHGDAPRLYRIADIADHGERRIEAVAVHPSVYDAPILSAPGLAAPAARASPPPVWGRPVFAVIDAPSFGELADGARALFAAFADPWPGAVALYREGPGGPEFVASARGRATMGRLAAPLGPGPSGRWTDATVRLTLAFGALAARSEAEVLAGANALLVETAAGWEVLQFAGAELGADGAWTLSRLLRGQAGTETAATGAAAGARVVFLNAALAEAPYPADLRGEALAVEAGPERDHPGTENFAQGSVVLDAANLKPLSPVHLAATPVAGGLRLSWIRRTRTGGDGWTGEVPLGEAFERYRITIFDGAAALRTVETATTEYLYTDAQILADFGAGGIGAAAAFEAAQLSDSVGAGASSRKDL